ncbi:fused MFS/spermidine synthase [bacterium]|nr:fused MFS/spermidine synthase [bacterium]
MSWLGLLLLLLAGPVLSDGEVCNFRSQWNHVVVEQRQGMRTLRFGETVQSIYDLKNPNRLVVPYTRTAMVGAVCLGKPQRVLFVGVGGGSMVKYLHRTLPQCEIDAVDLDAEVLRVAGDYFDLRSDERLHLIAAEGRGFLAQGGPSYDAIFLDAYGDTDIPTALASEEFLELVKSRLENRGVVTGNLWGERINPRYADMVQTYRQVFSEVHTIQAGSDNRIVLAFPQRANLSRETLASLASFLPGLGDLRGEVLRGYRTPPQEGEVIRDCSVR